MRNLLLAGLTVCSFSLSVGTVSAPDEPQPGRHTVFISDLHFGIGKDIHNEWDPTEDFRWSTALQAFLQEISRWGNNTVDLIIVGDLLELWQPPAALKCVSTRPDYGCTVPEIERLAEAVLKAHQLDLKALGEFSSSGQNRLFIIPGNHDAALLIPSVGQRLTDSLKTQRPVAVSLVGTGVWVSDDGLMVAEHGHQIGADVNKFQDWPTVTKVRDGRMYLARPWGEQFVQQRFNDSERLYPIIDNVVPETAGIRLYRSGLGWLEEFREFSIFLKFNILETSLRQKGAALGPGDASRRTPLWDLEWARQELGYKLFADALPGDDPLRMELHSSTGAEWDRLRTELDRLPRDVQALPDHELMTLCAQLEIRALEAKENDGASVSRPSHPRKQPRGTTVRCTHPTQGALLQSSLYPRQWILKPHLEGLIDRYPNMELFVYGHTHEWDLEHIRIFGGVLQILNTGAFQRLIDEEHVLAEARQNNWSPREALERLPLESLPACYVSVLVEYHNSRPAATLKNWHMDEEGQGEFVDACDPRCASSSKNCALASQSN
jgi:UDP-2,3-diacylglucosamine pyrophosphatase LpxH